jgi:hypothetical protein
MSWKSIGLLSKEPLLGLVAGGLATVSFERMMAGNKQIEIARLRISEAAQRVLAS